MNTDDKDKQEVVNLRRELAETKYRLYTFENSRSAKLARFAKEFIRNPIKGIANGSELRQAFKKTSLEKPDFSHIDSQATHPPLPIKTNNPLLVYPHIKVACLGTLEDVAEVCHAFEIGDMNWVNLLDVGVDFVMVSDAAYRKSSPAARWLSVAKEHNIPIVAVKTESSILPDALKDAPIILNQTTDQNIGTPDIAFVNIYRDNPINLEFRESKTVGLVGVRTSDISSSFSGSAEVFNSDKATDYGAVIVNGTALNKDYKKQCDLLACCMRGVPIITYDLAPKDTPFLNVSSKVEAIEYVASLLNDKERRERANIPQRRKVSLHHSQLERFEFILNELKIPSVSKPVISSIISTKRPQNIPHVIGEFTKQSYAHKELVLVLHGSGFDEKMIDKELSKVNVDYKILQKSTNTIFGENLNDAVEAARGDFITKMDDDDYYGENHLLDLLSAYRYSRADIVGKWSNWVYLKNKDRTTTWVIEHQETYTHHLPGATFMMARDFMRKARFGRVKKGIDSELYRRIEARGGTMYSTHRYNFVRVRHSGHTYDASDEKFLARCSYPEFKGVDENRTMI
jgi:hypothetical protein